MHRVRLRARAFASYVYIELFMDLKLVLLVKSIVGLPHNENILLPPRDEKELFFFAQREDVDAIKHGFFLSAEGVQTRTTSR